MGLFEIKDKVTQSNNQVKQCNSCTYSSPLGLTQQFRFCGNAFRVDMYKGCDFGCKYCFANGMSAKGHNDGFAEAKIEQVEKLFTKAFDTQDMTNDITIELLRKKVPLHCGGMSDPFQKREFEHKLTYKLIELSNKYQYPIIFSTKTSQLPKEYFDILDPNIHAFQISIMGWDDEYIRKYETNTPTAKERLEFLKKLRELGFWCSIRIQPLVNLEQAIKLLENASTYPSYVTIEHLKILCTNDKINKLFVDEYANTTYKKADHFRIEVEPAIKQKNIEVLMKLANSNKVLVGVGDNDLHHLSQSRCCCGIDTIQGNMFDNWLKYNLTYFVTGECESPDLLWTPKCNCRKCFFSDAVKPQFKKFTDFKEITKDYIKTNTNLVYKSEYENVLHKLGLDLNNRLF